VWAEIRNDFIDDDGTIFIDAWRTMDDNEDGEVLATVTTDGRVEYMNEQAKKDKRVQEAVNEARYKQLAEKAYGYYIADWCRRRGYNIAYVDEECGFNGECYASYKEFLDNEFRDEDYMRQLLNERDFENWKELAK
jgi:hypothetical protein